MKAGIFDFSKKRRRRRGSYAEMAANDAFVFLLMPSLTQFRKIEKQNRLTW
jgi:hypothetical protein